MFIPITEFMQDVVPADGIRTIVLNAAGSVKFKHKLFDSSDNFYQACIDYSVPSQNTYFAMASFIQGFHDSGRVDDYGNPIQSFRKQSNVKQLKSLWLDIDVGTDKSYKTQKEAILSLREFIATTKLPTPWIVSSGSGGLHVYWAMEEAIDPDTWFALATQLHGAVLKVGLDADPSRTRDSASILRVPNSYNCKHNPPVEVKILLRGKPFPVELYQEKLQGYAVPPTKATAPNTDLSMLGIDDKLLSELGAMLGGVAESLPEIESGYPERSAEELVTGCAQLREQEFAEEPVWRGMLATLRHCTGGIEMAHKLSKQYKGYSESETNSKIELLEINDVPPYTCATFKAHRPEICESCSFNGQINSPMSVKASAVATVEVSEETGLVQEVVKTENAPENADKIKSEIPTIKSGIYKSDKFGCHIWKDTDDDGYWLKIYDYPVYPIQRIRGVTPQGDPEISYIFRRHHRNGVDDFQIPGDVLMSPSLAGFLGSVGFIISVRNKKDMVALMVDLVRATENDIEEVSVKDYLGWNDKFDTFLLGNKLYKDTGEIIDVRPKGKAIEYSSRTVAMGDLSTWTRIANVYSKTGLEWAQVTVLSGFASPLMPIGALEKAALIFLTGEKGAGKSTALQLAVSIYGDPTRMMINKNDTAISRLEKLGILHNITAAFDEMTDLTPQEASAFTYQITQGRGKDRMTDGGKGLQQNTTFWSCLPVMSANDSMIDSLARHSHDATAQMSRVLEIEAKDISNFYTPVERIQNERLVREMPNNYGTAGAVYVHYLVTHKEQVKHQILEVEKLFTRESGLTNTHRFWIYMSTRLVVGCMIAKKLGLVDYDPKKIFTFLVNQVKQAVKGIERYQFSPENMLADFMFEHVGERLVVKSEIRPPEMKADPSEDGYSDVGYVMAKPQGNSDLSMRIELKERRALISRHTIKAWCKASNIPFNGFMDALDRSGVLRAAKRRVLLGKGTEFAALGRTECVEVTLEGLLVDKPELIEDCDA